MTVGELRKVLEGAPEDTVVVKQQSDRAIGNCLGLVEEAEMRECGAIESFGQSEVPAGVRFVID